MSSVVSKWASSAADDSGVGSVSWSSVSNVYAWDGSFASATLGAGQISHYLRVAFGGFGIPAAATVVGVAVGVYRRADTPGTAPTITDYSVKLCLAGSVAAGSDNKASGDTWPDPTNGSQYGGTTDTWGLGLTASDVNHSGFGVAIAAQASGGILSGPADVDGIVMNVYYLDALAPDDKFVASPLGRLSRPWRARSYSVVANVVEPPTPQQLEQWGVISAMRRMAGSRSRFVSIGPPAPSLFGDPTWTEIDWTPAQVAAFRSLRPRPRPMSRVFDAGVLPAGHLQCSCEPGGVVALGNAYGAVLVEDGLQGVAQPGAVIVSEGYGRAVVVSTCLC